MHGNFTRGVRCNLPSHALGKVQMILAIAIMVVGCIVLVNGSDFSDATGETSGSCGANLTWAIDGGGNLSIEGTGPMDDYWYNTPWDPHAVKTLVLPDGLTYIGKFAFCHCSITNVVLPDSVTSIGKCAFDECFSLQTVTLPANLEIIGDDAFNGCPLTNYTLSIPGSVSLIGWSAFSRNNLAAFDVDSDNEQYSSEDGVLFDKNKTILVAYPGYKADNSYEIPNTVETIQGYSFQGNHYVESVSIPDSVTDIGTGAFLGSRITSIVIPNGVTVIEYTVFAHSKLSSITIPDSVTTLNGDAFQGCPLTSIEIPSSVTSVGQGCFEDCTSLSSVVINGSSTTMGGYVFRNCSSLTSVTLPGGLERIETGTFDGCSSLESIVIPDSVKYVSNHAFDGSGLNSIVIPDSVTSIGQFAFSYTPLTSVTLGSNVSSISNNAFEHCTDLSTVINKTMLPLTAGSSDYGSIAKYCTNLVGNVCIDQHVGDFVVSYNDYSKCCVLTKYVGSSDNLALGTVVIDAANYAITDISGGALDDCVFLRTITIGDSVKTIPSNAFNKCTSLESITVSGTNLNYASVAGVLYDKGITKVMHYPEGKTDSTYVVPSSVSSLHPSIAKCSFLQAIDVEPSNTSYSSSNGVLFSKDGDQLLICPHNVDYYEFDDKVKSVSEYAFYGSSIKKVEFASNSVVTLNMGAFLDCCGLQSIIINDGAEVHFGTYSIAFLDEQAHTIYVSAKEGFTVPATSCYGNVNIVYGMAPEGDPAPENDVGSEQHSVTLYVVIGAVAVVALIIGAFILMKRRN